MSRVPKAFDISPPVARHTLRGVHAADLSVGSINVLLHRYAILDEWFLRSASDAFWRLYWPVKPGGLVWYEGDRYPLKVGVVYLIPPHTMFVSECLQPFAKWYIHFTTPGCLEDAPKGLFAIPGTPRIRTLLKGTCPEPLRHKSREEEASGPLRVVELVSLVLQAARLLFQEAPAPHGVVQRCIERMRERLTERLTLQVVARFAGVSTRRLSQLFRAQTGFPPMRYLIELRLNHAMKLLRQTNLNLESVAEQCGFPNRYYLTRMFSRHRATTPAAFRKQAGT